MLNIQWKDVADGLRAAFSISTLLFLVYGVAPRIQAWSQAWEKRRMEENAADDEAEDWPSPRGKK